MSYDTKEKANAARKALQAELGVKTVTLTVTVPESIACRVGRASGPWDVFTVHPADLDAEKLSRAVKRGCAVAMQADARPVSADVAAKRATRLTKDLRSLTSAERVQILAALKS